MDRGVSQTPGEITAHYQDRYREEDRLTRPQGRLEFLRTMELLSRFLPSPPSVLLDVGGASGAYAIPLAEAGYEVHLIDPIGRHVELAGESSRAASRPLASIGEGDARNLPHSDQTFDAVVETEKSILGASPHLLVIANKP